MNTKRAIEIAQRESANAKQKEDYQREQMKRHNGDPKARGLYRYAEESAQEHEETREAMEALIRGASMADAIRSAMAWLYDANTPDDRKLSHLLNCLGPVAKAAGLFIEPHSLAHLTARVRRQPPSLGNSFYHLEIGTVIRVREINPSGTSARCYCGEPTDRRISEDYFDVALTDLQLGPAAQDDADSPANVPDEIAEHFHMLAEENPANLCPECDGTGEIEEPLTESYPCPHCKGGSEQ